MACSGRPAQLVNITAIQRNAEIRIVEPARPRKVDFHCPECGHTGPNIDHTCLGKKPVAYQLSRTKICSGCRYSEGNICTLYKSLHPDRDCFIDVGIAMPEAKCPMDAWPKVLYRCKECDSVTFNENGVSSCPVCKKSEPRACSMPYRIVDHKEPPLAATSDLLIITVAAGQKAWDLLELTGPQMKRYAEKCGADFHAITNNLYPEYPLANKFRLKNLVTNYQRVLFLDVDVWVRASAADLFAPMWGIPTSGLVMIHEDHPYITDKTWIESDRDLTARQQQVEPVPMRLLNTGVVLFDGSQSDIWTPPPLPFAIRHIAEQTWVEFNLAKSKYPVALLGTEYNTQWWFPNFTQLEPTAHFVHLADCPHEERIYRFRKYARDEVTYVAKELYNRA